MRRVGIIGGMGPEATVLLMQRVIAAVPARDDADHVPLLVDNNPQVPSRIKALIEGGGEDPGPVLCSMARGLQQAGCAALAMPCNTAHAWASEIRAAASIPFIDMIEASVRRLVGRYPGRLRIGMLASPAVRLAGVFDAAFADAGLQALWADDDSRLLQLIRAVKRGEPRQHIEHRFATEARRLSERGAQLLLIACSELSLLGPVLADEPPVVDTLDALAAEIVGFCLSDGEDSAIATE